MLKFAINLSFICHSIQNLLIWLLFCVRDYHYATLRIYHYKVDTHTHVHTCRHSYTEGGKERGRKEDGEEKGRVA